MNERFRVSEKDLVFWQPGLDQVLANYAEGRGIAPRTVKGILRNLLNPPTGIFYSYLYDHVVNKQNMPCYAGSQIVHVDPFGDVYPCNFKLSPDRIVGNLREKSFDEIWAAMPSRILKEIKRCDCMYPNGLCGDSDIYPSIKTAPCRYGVVPQKLLTGRPLVEAGNHNARSALTTAAHQP